MRIYDPLQAIKRMQKAGVTKEIAEAVVEEIKESQKASLNELATKQDVKDIKNEIDLFKQEIRFDMEILKRDMIIKLTSIMVFCITVGTGTVVWFIDKIISSYLPH